MWVYVGLRGVSFIIDPCLRFETGFFFRLKYFTHGFLVSLLTGDSVIFTGALVGCQHVPLHWKFSTQLFTDIDINGQLIFSILWTLHLLLLTEFERTNAVVFSFIWVLRLLTLTWHQICFVKLSGISQVPTRCSLATGYGNRRKREENQSQVVTYGCLYRNHHISYN